MKTTAVVLCTDCALIIANDDDSGINPGYVARHRAAMAEHMPKIPGTWAVGDQDESDPFSRTPCDACGTTFAGDRHAGSVIA